MEKPPEWWWAVAILIARIALAIWKSVGDTAPPEHRRSRLFRIRHAAVAVASLLAASVLYFVNR